MLDIIESIRSVIDAPPEVVLACPAGVIAALHFANMPSTSIKGARCDSVVRLAKADAVHRPKWIKRLGVSLGLGIASWSFVSLTDPHFWSRIIQNLPI